MVNWFTLVVKSLILFYYFKGDPKQKKEIPKEVPTIYSATQKRPLTASREYGHYVHSPQAKQMHKLQSRMSYGMKCNKELLYQ